jgi:catechol 2,3-dioxygenase-like lactoylglutathione lyase family enzyme
MIKRITHTSILVNDIDDALKFYVDVLGFEKRSDNPMPGMGDDARWVTVSPKEQPDFEVVLQQTVWGPGGDSAKERKALVGKQPGFVLEVDDVRQEHDRLAGAGVTFVMEIEDYPWGTQTAFADLYGNVHVLSQSPAG